MATDPGRAPDAPTIFVSYRRGDTTAYARNVHDRLVERFGDDRVFFDVDSIRPGTDFPRVIAEALDECDILLALIGPDWLARRGPLGRRRLHDPADFVHIEILAALRRGILVIPVLVDGARTPTLRQLPPALAALAHTQAFELSDRRWAADVRTLIVAMEGFALRDEAGTRRFGTTASGTPERSSRVTSPYTAPRHRQRASIAPRRRKVGLLVGSAVLLFAVFGAAVWDLGWPSPDVAARDPAASDASRPTSIAPLPVTADPTPVEGPASVDPDTRAPLRVYNNSDVPGLAARAAENFKSAGWTIDEVGGFQGRLLESAAYYRPGTDEEAAAKELAAQFQLVAKPRFAEIQDARPGVIVIILSDYADTLKR